jgi:hypothetical protein
VLIIIIIYFIMDISCLLVQIPTLDIPAPSPRVEHCIRRREGPVCVCVYVCVCVFLHVCVYMSVLILLVAGPSDGIIELM